jgi:hypothetical protein
MAGAATPFILGWFFASIPFSAPAGDGTGLGSLIILGFFWLLGLLAVTFSIIQFLDARNHTVWGAFILAGYGFMGLVVAFFVVLPFFSSPAIQDLPVLMVAVVGPVLGGAGGIWGLTWDRSPTSGSAVSGASRLGGLFQKKWLLVLLLILLALETSILILIAVEWSLGNQSFPPISLMAPVEAGCGSLTARVVSQGSANRTVLYDCSGSPGKGPALKMSVFNGGGSVASVPVFTLPQEYRKLWLIDGGSGNCTSGAPTPIRSSEVVGLGAYWQPSTYDYCAAVSPAGPVTGFTVRWSLGRFPPYSPPPPLFSVSISPNRITVPAGQNQNVTARVTSLGKFNGTVRFSGGFSGGPNPTGYLELSFQPATVLVRAGGSNSTVVTVFTFSSTQRGLNIVAIDALSSPWTETADINVTVT